MLSEISRSQQDKWCMVPLTGCFWRSQIQRQMVGRWLPGAEGAGNGELFNGYSVSVLQDEKVLDICFNKVSILNMTVQLKMVQKVIFLYICFIKIKQA